MPSRIIYWGFFRATQSNFPYNGNMVNNINKNVFMVGIGGISMSAIAKDLHFSGHTVYGSDESVSIITQELESLGIKVFKGHKKTHINKNIGTIIYSSAIGDNNPEIKAAKNLGLQLMERKEALKYISQEYTNRICVAGSHGKTTSTSMISHLLNEYGIRFNAHIGGRAKNFKSNFVCNGETDKNFLVLESCEYRDNFLSLAPTIGVILNISLDHTDYFKTEKDIVNSFVCFSNKIIKNGTLILNIDDKNCGKVLNKTYKNKKIVTISCIKKSATFYLEKIYNTNNQFIFNIYHNGNKIVYLCYYSGGEHNLYNILASVAVICEFKEDITDINEKINKFEGVERRQEYVGKINGAPVYMDYAHHPDEIDKIIKQYKPLTKGKLYVFFQPHTFSRTKSFWSRFIKSLTKADKILLYPIYKAREKQLPGVTSYRLAKDIRSMGRTCYYAENLFCAYNYLSYFVIEEDTILVLGAGDIDEFRKFFTKSEPVL